MRERTLKINQETLVKLSNLYTGSKVAKKLGVSRQVFHKYKHGLCDMPESRLDQLCQIYGLDKESMIVEAV